MQTNEILKKMPRDGFLKTGRDSAVKLSDTQRIALIRKGNELFNKGDFETAKKIFLTTGYTDGITRIGDYYYKQKNILEAFRMYIMAPAPRKKEIMVEKMAAVLKIWLKDEVK
ncbi:MAG: hypothetical protein AB1798_02275 [Spirochaetota bacterium]